MFVEGLIEGTTSGGSWEGWEQLDVPYCAGSF